MYYRLVVLNFILFLYLNLGSTQAGDGDSDGGGGLIAQLRNDANLDLSVDEEYEDLRAELLAYHTALASLASSSSSRRSVVTTPCWTLGGICVHHKLCTGARYITEIPGCKDKLNVCCFTWNRYRVRDLQDQGINSLALPWSVHQEFGGKGVILPEEQLPVKEGKLKIKKKDEKIVGSDDADDDVALIITGDSGEIRKRRKYMRTYRGNSQ